MSGAFICFNSIDNSTAFSYSQRRFPPLPTKHQIRFVFAFRKVRNIVTWIIIQFFLFLSTAHQALVISKQQDALTRQSP